MSEPVSEPTEADLAAAVEASARLHLSLLLQPAANPALTEDEVTALVGVAVEHGAEIALVFGWLAKAAKVAGKIGVKAGDVAQSASQLHAHCLTQAAGYAAGRQRGPTAGPVVLLRHVGLQRA